MVTDLQITHSQLTTLTVTLKRGKNKLTLARLRDLIDRCEQAGMPGHAQVLVAAGWMRVRHETYVDLARVAETALSETPGAGKDGE